jgi:quercetin dioxygenase-like cupin family protein
MQLIDNAQVSTFRFNGNSLQILAGADHGLKTIEVIRLNIEPGKEIPPSRHDGEVAVLTLRGTGRVVVEKTHFDLKPDTTLIIPPNTFRQLFNTGKGPLVLVILRSLISA